MKILIFLTVVVVASCVVSRWRYERAGRFEELDVMGHPVAVQATAVKALKGLNPLATVRPEGSALVRLFESTATVGLMRGSGSHAAAIVDVVAHPERRGFVRVTVRNDYQQDLCLGVPIAPRAVHQSRRAVERVVRAIMAGSAAADRPDPSAAPQGEDRLG